jgi:hypothetical protein
MWMLFWWRFDSLEKWVLLRKICFIILFLSIVLYFIWYRGYVISDEM